MKVEKNQNRQVANPEPNNTFWPIQDLLLEKADHYGDPKFSKLLTDLQANILKHHGKRQAVLAFVTFHKGKIEHVKNWLKEQGLQLTSAMSQFKESHEENSAELQIIKCLYLSHQGYQYLNIDNRSIPNEPANAFVGGLMKRTPFRRQHNYRENNYEKDIHALLLMASNDPKNIEREIQQLKADFDEGASPQDGGKLGQVFFEDGKLNPDGDSGKSFEWFGFRDGISNPRFFPKNDILNKINKGQNNYEKPSTLGQVLIVDGLGGKPHSCGSFMVFLKLEQDKKTFESMVDTMALQLDSTPEYAAALLIGRHQDGTPLTLSKEPDEKKDIYTFDYKNDPDGFKCPYHAHLRKSNPRTPETDKFRIVRRGMIYGSREPESSKRGLLFLSFQSNLEHQFEDLVNRWTYRSNPYDADHSSDPILSDTGDSRGYSLEWGKPVKVALLHDHNLVTFRGGGYFFAPSISFFDNLQYLE